MSFRHPPKVSNFGLPDRNSPEARAAIPGMAAIQKRPVRLHVQDTWNSAFRLPYISNNVGPVKLFLNTLLSFHLKELFSFAFFGFLPSCIDAHGSFVI